MISVIVSIFNTGEYLSKCIDSILKQTYKDLEIILIDDGSTDMSASICDYYKEIDSRIVVIHQENSGIVAARKRGFEVANGEYIGFVDSDDWIEPNMYETLHRLIKDDNVQIAMCGRYEESENLKKEVYHGIPEGRYGRTELESMVFPEMIIGDKFFEWRIFPSYWDKLFCKNTIQDALMSVDDSIVMGEDAACIYPCLMKVESIYVLRECLYHYRQRSSSMVKHQPGNTTLERKRFLILYQSTMKALESYDVKYDLKNQWKKYLLFLMTPRADYLYENIEELTYLFPFPEVKKGERIIIYGAGLWGMHMYSYLKKTNFCEVLAVVDQNYKNICKKDYPVVSPNVIHDMSPDAIIITASYADTRNSILRELINNFPNKRIYVPNEEEIFSKKTMLAFGLLQ